MAKCLRNIPLEIADRIKELTYEQMADMADHFSVAVQDLMCEVTDIDEHDRDYFANLILGYAETIHDNEA